MENLKKFIRTIGASHKTKKVLVDLADAVDANASAANITVVEETDKTLVGGDLQAVLEDLAERIKDLEAAE